MGEAPAGGGGMAAADTREDSSNDTLPPFFESGEEQGDMGSEDEEMEEMARPDLVAGDADLTRPWPGAEGGGMGDEVRLKINLAEERTPAYYPYNDRLQPRRLDYIAAEQVYGRGHRDEVLSDHEPVLGERVRPPRLPLRKRECSPRLGERSPTRSTSRPLGTPSAT